MSFLNTRIQVTNTGGASSVVANDVIMVDGEQMKVTAVVAGSANIWNLTVVRAQNGTTEATHTSGTTVYEMVAATMVEVTNSGGSSSVAVGDIVVVGGEQIELSACSPGLARRTLGI